MSHIYPARTADISLTTGLGPLAVSGLPPSVGLRSFNSVMELGDTIYLGVANREKDEWEEGLYTYVGVNRLARTTIYQSSNSDAVVNFSAGIKDVWATIPSFYMYEVDRLRTEAAPPSDINLLFESLETGNSFVVTAGNYNWYVNGVWSGATAQLQVSPDNAENWYSPSDYVLTDDGVLNVSLSAGLVRVEITGPATDTLLSSILGRVI